MKLEMSSKNRALFVGVALVVLAFLFWSQVLSPKRDEVKKLGAQVEAAEALLAQHRSEIATGQEAKAEFAGDYQRLVVVGKAVPGGDESASLLVQVNRIAERTGGTFHDIKLSSSGGGEAAPAPAVGVSGEPASATEVAASLLPLGAEIGPAGLAVMPYDVAFEGNFFDVADFIKGLDELVETKSEKVRVDGRLVTINGFSLEAAPNKGFPQLTASFSLTTYLTPPGEGATPGTSPSAPPGTESTPAAQTLGGTP
jgi:Tfp pilus assembly protein PilO